jgi:phenylalanyl-tRNA synthetase beta chain
MKLVLDWIGDYVDCADLAPEVVAEKLTAAGHAVEGIERAPAGVVFDCDLTTNRPDAMCHRGLARELAAILERPLAPVSFELKEDTEPAAPHMRIEIDAADGCAVFHGRVIRGVRVGPSPSWLVDRLQAIGVRSINNVVDVTNYVLWELGQPLHAFDLATLRGGVVRVRRAAADEVLVTLDGIERKLPEGTLVVADAERAVGLAGIMGGLETEVTDTTVDILLEAAFFTPTEVRAAGRATGLHTDAKHRFERGADPVASAQAIDRAAAMIAELAGGRVLAGRLRGVGDEPRAAAVVELEHYRLERFVGIAIPAADVERILGALGFEVEAVAGGWRVKAPSWRIFDIEEEADLFEEVARIYGFDRIPATLPAVVGADAPESLSHRVRRTVRRVLVGAGLVEVVNYAFHDQAADDAWPGLEAAPAPRLANPLSERLAIMRRSLAPGLIASARFNQRRGAESVRLFEIGHVFWRAADGSPREADALGLVVGGSIGTPWSRKVALDVFDAKGVLEAVAESLGVELRVSPANGCSEALDPDQVASLVTPAGLAVGWFGRLAEYEAYDLFVAELRLDRLEVVVAPPQVVPAPRFPAIEADLTLTHPLAVPWAEIAAAIDAEAVADLVSVALVDRYQGPGVPAGAVNTTIGFRYQNSARSLTQDEVNERHMLLAARLTARFGRENTV